MTFIKSVPPEQAKGRLKQMYDRTKGPDGRVDNILTAHGLRPASLEGHMTLYKNVLHHNANTTPKWFLETVGVLVSMLNECAYCVDHHFAGLSRLLNDNKRADAINTALSTFVQSGALPSGVFDKDQAAALEYAKALTLAPSSICPSTITAMRDAGWDDGGILEINQVAAYFSYANRTVLGLGVTTEGDELGLSPNNNDDEHDWGHR